MDRKCFLTSPTAWNCWSLQSGQSQLTALEEFAAQLRFSQTSDGLSDPQVNTRQECLCKDHLPYSFMATTSTDAANTSD